MMCKDKSGIHLILKERREIKVDHIVESFESEFYVVNKVLDGEGGIKRVSISIKNAEEIETERGIVVPMIRLDTDVDWNIKGVVMDIYGQSNASIEKAEGLAKGIQIAIEHMKEIERWLL